MKMESVEFYAELLYRTTQLGGPRELEEEKLERLYGVIGKQSEKVCFDRRK